MSANLSDRFVSRTRGAKLLDLMNKYSLCCTLFVTRTKVKDHDIAHSSNEDSRVEDKRVMKKRKRERASE